MNENGIQGQNFNVVLRRIHFRRGLAFGIIIITALLAFEIFNYSTTDYALTDLLGELSFLGVHWSTILAIAFCGIDFAGIARLFTPEEGNDQPGEVWYLFGAWLLAATMNAMLTWWGVSLAVLNHQTLGNAVIERTTLLRVVPIFVAVLVWLIRVLIIGTFSVAGDRLFSQPDQRFPAPQRPRPAAIPAVSSAPAPLPARSLGGRVATPRPVAAAPAPGSASTFRPSPKPAAAPAQPEPNYGRPDPTYQNVSMSSAPHESSPASFSEPGNTGQANRLSNNPRSPRPGSPLRR
ncbi:MAG TPA: hypothetical protein VF823_13205 [Anaerolineales bacterium]